jgi:pyruvate,water dikinase
LPRRNLATGRSHKEEFVATTESTGTQGPSVIPAPPDFPIRWEEDGDERNFWTTDRMHFPNQVTPLDDEVLRILYSGFGLAAERFDVPVRMIPRRFNTYHYLTVAPLPLPHEEMEAMGQRSEAKVGQAMGSIAHDWSEVYLPEIRRQIDEASARDYAAASNAQLAEYLDEAIKQVVRQWEIHFTLAVPFLISPSIFEDMYRDLFGDQSALDAYRLLQGFDNRTLAMGRALWRLSRKAAADPDVRRAFEEQPPEQLAASLEQSEGGRSFLSSLREFLDEYGHRGGGLEISFVSWLEDPTPVLRMVREYIAQGDQDPDAELAALAETRERLVAEARQRLQNYPQQVRDQFEFLLKAAQEAVVVSEDHGFWIDFRALHEFRRLVIAIGERLAADGVLAARDDIFYLTFDDLRGALAGRVPQDLESKIAAGKAEMEHYSTVTPPPAVGTPPPGPPPDNPVARAMGKFFGTPPQPSEEPNLLKGAAGSAGIARGTARVIRSLTEASRLKPGDILVAETTTPPWTPLFGTAAAVITDTGGILSHCAVVAREYGIPAVVGLGVATVVVKDGQQIEVDGTAGTVRIL